MGLQSDTDDICLAATVAGHQVCAHTKTQNGARCGLTRTARTS